MLKQELYFPHILDQTEAQVPFFVAASFEVFRTHFVAVLPKSKNHIMDKNWHIYSHYHNVHVYKSLPWMQPMVYTAHLGPINYLLVQRKCNKSIGKSHEINLAICKSRTVGPIIFPRKIIALNLKYIVISALTHWTMCESDIDIQHSFEVFDVQKSRIFFQATFVFWTSF